MEHVTSLPLLASRTVRELDAVAHGYGLPLNSMLRSLISQQSADTDDGPRGTGGAV